MEKRYQVFVSSTFVDLVIERQHVMQALHGVALCGLWCKKPGI